MIASLEGTHSNILEAHANDEVGGPVGTTRHSHGSRPRTLREQLSYKEPGDWTRADLKEGHKAEDRQHADVTHPRNAVLSGGRTGGVRFVETGAPTTVDLTGSLTSKASAVVMMMAQMHMPPNPSMWSVRRPIRSTRKSWE